MRIQVSTDSTADIPVELCEKYKIEVLPLGITYEDKEYHDGVDITVDEIYDILEKPGDLPMSSQVALTAYEDFYKKVWEQGFTDLIHVAINSKGSGTYQAGILAEEMFFDNYPEAKGQLNIHLIDSKTYSMAYGIPVVEGAKMASEGASVEEIIAHITDWIEHARPMFVPLDLKCVKKSGRISPAAAFVGDLIGLKPMITFEDGEPKILGKARGEAKSIALLIDTFMKERRPGTNYSIVYGRNIDAYETVQAEIAKVVDMPPMINYQVGCIIAINTGPNMIGIIYRT
ncbi:MAG: DegV family protein [Lachnospiraceae bacterium]|nr:DegV family protein [Lachnospiraceae bacterium]